MLAMLGFGATGILFIIFASTISQAIGDNAKGVVKTYRLAYWLLAATFFLWSIAGVIGDASFLALSVIIGDVGLLIATVLVLNIMLRRHNLRVFLLALGAATGVAALAIRTIFFYPEPFMTDGIIFFNSQRLVSFTLTAVFLLIWLPVNLYVAQLATAKHSAVSVRYRYMYVVATIPAAMFLLAKTPLAVVLSFSALAASFVGLIISNMYVNSLGVVHGKRK